MAWLRRFRARFKMVAEMTVFFTFTSINGDYASLHGYHGPGIHLPETGSKSWTAYVPRAATKKEQKTRGANL
eukprot:5143985-Amphidinium_carterae.1